MASRTTEWRHKTGRSKKRYPHGAVNYKGLAVSISRRFFQDLWKNYKEDLLQEIELLTIEATTKKRITGSRKTYGNSRDRIGIVMFSRAAQSRFHQIRKNYGLYRNKVFYSLKENVDST